MSDMTDISSSSYGILHRDNFDSELDEVAEQVRRLGYAILDSDYTSEQLQGISGEFDHARRVYVERWGEDRLRKLNELHTVRALLTHGAPVFLRLATHPKLLAVLGKLIVGKYVLNQQNGVVNPSGDTYSQGAWHRDLPYQHFVSNTPLAVNALFCLDDFTLENGATLVLPASHKAVSFPSHAYVRKNACQVEAKAGQFILMDCMLFHSGGRNRSASERRAINHAYMIPYFKQQIEIPPNIAPEGLSSEERAILGFDYRTPESIEAYFKSRERKNG